MLNLGKMEVIWFGGGGGGLMPVLTGVVHCCLVGRRQDNQVLQLAMVTHARVTSRRDYCRGLLCGLALENNLEMATGVACCIMWAIAEASFHCTTCFLQEWFPESNLRC